MLTAEHRACGSSKLDRSLPCVDLDHAPLARYDAHPMHSLLQASASGSSSTTSSAGQDGKAREDAARQAREAQERARRAAATAEASTQKINDEIEDMLAQMKRDLGIK